MMTATDSQTVACSDPTDLVFSTTKNNDNASKAGILQVTSGEPESHLDEPNSDPLIYFRKGRGDQPQSGKMIAGHISKNKTSTSSSTSKNNPSHRSPANPPRVANLFAGGSIKSTSSKDKDKIKRGD